MLESRGRHTIHSWRDDYCATNWYLLCHMEESFFQTPGTDTWASPAQFVQGGSPSCFLKPIIGQAQCSTYSGVFLI